MSSETNKAVFERFVTEVINGRHLDAVDELLAPDVIEHEVFDPNLPPGREGVKIVLAMFHAAFPDLKVTIEDMIAEGDKVVARTTWQGTHQGELMGIPPTGRQVAFASIDIMRVGKGQLVEHWAVTDTMALMQQLGAISEPGTAAA